MGNNFIYKLDLKNARAFSLEEEEMSKIEKGCLVRGSLSRMCARAALRPCKNSSVRRG